MFGIEQLPSEINGSEITCKCEKKVQVGSPYVSFPWPPLEAALSMFKSSLLSNDGFF